MTMEEILGGESKEVEYKEMIPKNSKNYTKTVVAFSNCAGGLLVFGVEDNTLEVKGVPQEKVFEMEDIIANAIVDSCEPMIDFDIKFKVVEGKTIIIVQVFPGKYRPYYLKSEGKPKGVYVRLCGSTRVADEFTVKELEFEGANKSYDRMPAIGETVTEADVEQLCDTMYQYALSRCLTTEEKQSVKRITKMQLLSWGLLVEKEGKIYPTNGYLLLSSKHRQTTTIQCGVFKGTNKAVFIDKKEYGGPIYEQIDEAYQFVLRNIRMGAEFGDLLRRDVYELPIDSIRELIANAVSHRSYLDDADIQVALYDDRLEVVSPGTLIGGLTVDEMKKGYSRPRNRGLVSALAYMKVVERWGSGIPRLFEDCAKAGLKEPLLIESAGYFVVCMFRKTALMLKDSTGLDDNVGKVSGKSRESVGLNNRYIDNFYYEFKRLMSEWKKDPKRAEILNSFGEDATRILILMYEKPKITLDEIAEDIGVTRRTVERQVKKLREAEIVYRVGGNRSGVWNVRTNL